MPAKVVTYTGCVILTFFFVECAFAQFLPPLGVPTPSPEAGYDSEAPKRSKKKKAKKGQLIVQLTDQAREKITRRFKKRHGQEPSVAQFRKEVARSLGLRKVDELEGNTVFVKGRRVNQAKVKRAKRQNILNRAEENLKLFTFESASDLLYIFGLHYGLNNTGIFGTAGMDIDIEEAWDVTLGDSELIVGVIDTGVALDHPDLANNIWKNPLEIPGNNIDDDNNGFIDDISGWDFISDDNDPDDDHFHGTHVAGTIAAERNNAGAGFGGLAVGVAPNVKIMALKILDSEGAGDTAGIIKAINYAVGLKERGINIRVLNASLGGGGATQAVEDALRRANQAGIVFVAAAGNNASDNDVEGIYPAGYPVPNVISVAALDANGQLAGFSNFGAETVDVAAPGDFVWSTFIANLYFPLSGTSMAAPHVAGIAALVLSKEPNLTPAQIRSRIMNTTKPLPALEGVIQVPGIVSAAGALK